MYTVVTGRSEARYEHTKKINGKGELKAAAKEAAKELAKGAQKVLEPSCGRLGGSVL